MSDVGISLGLPQDGIIAEPSDQAFARAAAPAVAEQTDSLRDSPCRTHIRGGNRRQPVGERLSFAFLI